jgi:transcriptional accessory protein Tex/SPT6
MDNENTLAAENQPQIDLEQAGTQAAANAATEEPQVAVESIETSGAVEAPADSTGPEAAPEATASAESGSPTAIEDLKPGMRLMGKVKNIVDFGAFIDVGVGRDGLAHISTLKRAGIDKTLQVGDEVEVQVRRADLDNNRISLTIPGAGRADKTRLEDLEVGATVNGRVVRLVDFGAFVDIDAQTDGLLHISQLSDGFVSQVSEVLEVGQEVQVRILEVDTERRRISLTMKSEAPEAPARTEFVGAPEVQERPRRDSFGGERNRRSWRDDDGEDRPPRERRGRGRRREPQVISTEQEPAEPGSTGLFAEAWEKAMRDRRDRGRR